MSCHKIQSVPIIILKLLPIDSPDVGEPQKYPLLMPEIHTKWFRGSRTSLTLFWKNYSFQERSSNDFFKVLRRRIFQKRVRKVLKPLNHLVCTSSISSGYFSDSPTSGLSIGDNFRIMIGTDWILRQEIVLLIIFSRLKHETHVEYSTVWGSRCHFRYQKIFFEKFF